MNHWNPKFVMEIGNKRAYKLYEYIRYSFHVSNNKHVDAKFEIVKRVKRIWYLYYWKLCTEINWRNLFISILFLASSHWLMNLKKTNRNEDSISSSFKV
jgi:hypothetical protein